MTFLWTIEYLILIAKNDSIGKLLANSLFRSGEFSILKIGISTKKERYEPTNHLMHSAYSIDALGR
jgi:hypothetical protein